AAGPNTVAAHGSPRRNAPSAGPHAVHDACRLVPVDRGKYPAPGALGVRHVAVAHGTRHDADGHLARPGRPQLNVLDDQGSTELRAECRPHVTASAARLPLRCD